MNLYENIEYLARINAKTAYPMREDAIDKRIPYFKIYKRDGTLDVIGYNYQYHDNAPRMDLYCMYLKHGVLPKIHAEKTADICGFYNIELHDSYTYLNKPSTYKNVLTFSKFKNDTNPVLLPDPYMVINWGNPSIVDHTPWAYKKDKVCFYGTTTGNVDPLQNRRIQMCLWARGKPEYDFKITKVAQIPEKNIVESLGEEAWNAIYTPHLMGIKDQLNYKYHFLPDGNTCKFDVWYFNTNTLCLKDESKEMLWYYPMIKDKEHFLEVNEDTMGNVVEYYKNNPKESERIMTSAKFMATNLFVPMNHIYYTKSLFEAIAENK